jgi:hypothetical protein
MDTINQISDLLNALQTSPSPSTPLADGDLAPFEQAIDRIVTAENQASKAIAQAAIEKSKIQEETSAQYQQKIDFLTSQVHQAEIALSALEGSQHSPAQVQYANQLLDFKRQEVIYWQNRLAQAGSPSGSASL